MPMFDRTSSLAQIEEWLDGRDLVVTTVRMTRGQWALSAHSQHDDKFYCGGGNTLWDAFNSLVGAIRSESKG